MPPKFARNNPSDRKRENLFTNGGWNNLFNLHKDVEFYLHTNEI
jgi:hypothetical protein